MKTVAAAFALLFVMLAGCAQHPVMRTVPGTQVGTVNDDKLSRPMVDAFAQLVQQRLEQQGMSGELSITPDNLPVLLDEMVTIDLLAQEAVKRGLDKEPELAARLAWMERSVLGQELQARLLEPLQASEEDVTQYFTRFRDQFAYGLKVQWMVLADSAAALGLLESLKAGADFAALARRHSLDTVIAPGQFLQRGVGMAVGWDLADEENLFALEPGQFSGIIPLPKGCQIVKVAEKKRIVDNVSYNEMTRDYISSALTLDRQKTVRDSIVSALRAKGKVELKPEAYFQATK